MVDKPRPKQPTITSAIPMKSGVIPQVLAFLPCLSARRTPSGTYDLMGIYSDIHTDKLPGGFKMVVFVQLTGGHGKTPVKLDWIGPDGNVLGTYKGELDFQDPLEVVIWGL